MSGTGRRGIWAEVLAYRDLGDHAEMKNAGYDSGEYQAYTIDVDRKRARLEVGQTLRATSPEGIDGHLVPIVAAVVSVPDPTERFCRSSNRVE